VKLLTTHKDLGYEVWVHFDKTAEIYELFTDDEGVGYIGCADTLTDARKVASAFFEEQMQ
jgi:hypothetical protein